jgi:hypothetical protein
LVVDGAAPVIRILDRDRAGKARLRAVEHGTGHDDARAEQRFRLNLFLPLLEYVEVAAHVAHPRDAVSDEQRQRDFFAAREPVAEDHVDVHVPEAGDEKFPFAINRDAVDAARLYAIFGTHDGENPGAADQHAAMRQRLTALYVDYGDVINEQNSGAHLSCANRGGTRQEKEQEESLHCGNLTSGILIRQKRRMCRGRREELTAER